MRELEIWTLGFLLNALWQVPVVFCAAWAMALIARRATPASQHRIWVAALLAEAVLPACPTQVTQAARSMWAAVSSWSGESTSGIRVDFGPALVSAAGIHRLPSTVAAILFTGYGVTLAYLAARLTWGLWRTHTMRLQAERAGLPSVFSPNFEVCVSPEIAGPVTVGLLRGTVLLPTGFLERVTYEDLCAVLAHEGAHVHRRDFLKNALYAYATLPVAFHPALWLTRRRLAESREMVCDASAAEASAGRDRYAQSLLRLASLQVQRTPNRMLHAIGIFGLFDANSFERRLMYLTDNRSKMNGARRIATAVACVLLGLGTCATALAFRMGAPIGQNKQDSQSSGAANHIARVSGGVMAGNVLTKVNPVYPPDAKAEHISGAVVLSAVIGTDGAIENLQVVSGPEKLRSSALDAVRQWTYKPYVLNGVPVTVQTTITVNYSFGG